MIEKYNYIIFEPFKLFPQMKPKQFLDGNWTEGNYNHKFCFGLKLVKDLKKLAATPHPLFLGELPPPDGFVLQCSGKALSK